MTIKQFVQDNGITVTSKHVDKNPFMDDNLMNHYRSTLHINDNGEKRKFTLSYSKGRGLEGEPTAEEILYCLNMDFSYLQDGEDEFVNSLGFEEKKGRKIYKEIERQAMHMHDFLGYEKFEEFKKIEEEE